MSGLSDLLATPAAIAAAALWPAATGFPTWPAVSRGRMASTLAISVEVGEFVSVLVQRLTAPAGP